MTGKGDTYRKVKWREFGTNYDRIFGSINAEIEEERVREPQRVEYSQSDRTTERKAANFKEGSMRYAEYRIQYHPPTTDN